MINLDKKRPTGIILSKLGGTLRKDSEYIMKAKISSIVDRSIRGNVSLCTAGSHASASRADLSRYFIVSSRRKRTPARFVLLTSVSMLTTLTHLTSAALALPRRLKIPNTPNADGNQCYKDLRQADTSQDGVLTSTEYVLFVRLQSNNSSNKVTSFEDLPLHTISLFNTIACGCQENSKMLCCDNAINTSVTPFINISTPVDAKNLCTALTGSSLPTMPADELNSTAMVGVACAAFAAGFLTVAMLYISHKRTMKRGTAQTKLSRMGVVSLETSPTESKDVLEEEDRVTIDSLATESDVSKEFTSLDSGGRLFLDDLEVGLLSYNGKYNDTDSLGVTDSVFLSGFENDIILSTHKSPLDGNNHVLPSTEAAIDVETVISEQGSQSIDDSSNGGAIAVPVPASSGRYKRYWQRKLKELRAFDQSAEISSSSHLSNSELGLLITEGIDRSYCEGIKPPALCSVEDHSMLFYQSDSDDSMSNLSVNSEFSAMVFHSPLKHGFHARTRKSLSGSQRYDSTTMNCSEKEDSRLNCENGSEEGMKNISISSALICTNRKWNSPDSLSSMSEFSAFSGMIGISSDLEGRPIIDAEVETSLPLVVPNEISKDLAEESVENLSNSLEFNGSDSDLISVNGSNATAKIVEKFDGIENGANIRAEVEMLLFDVAPEEINHIDEIINQFSGCEEELLEKLRSKQERMADHRARDERNKVAKLEARREIRQRRKMIKTSKAVEEMGAQESIRTFVC